MLRKTKGYIDYEERVKVVFSLVGSKYLQTVFSHSRLKESKL